MWRASGLAAIRSLPTRVGSVVLRTTARTGLGVCAVALLVFSAARVVKLDAREFGQISADSAESSLIPSDSSPIGVTVHGNFYRSARVASAGTVYLLFMTVHARTIISDVDYWNRVIAYLNEQPSSLRDAPQFWGICDSGSGCAPFGRRARFHLLAYLDPYQMRAVATADRRRQALLYDLRRGSVASVPRATTPGDEARLIIRSESQNRSQGK